MRLDRIEFGHDILDYRGGVLFHGRQLHELFTVVQDRERFLDRPHDLFQPCFLLAKGLRLVRVVRPYIALG